MNYAKKITQLFATLAMLATQALVANSDTPASLMQNKNKELSSQVLADMQSILQSPAASNAISAVRAQAIRELFARKTHMVLINFYGNNQAIFSKWSNIYADFAQELLRTMPLGEILENFGLNPSTLGVVAHTTQHRSVESKEDEEAKDAAITGILQKGKSALTSLISFGIGSIVSVINLVQTQAQKLIKDTSSTAQTPEELLQSALRIALKKNLNRAQLEALHTFAKTKAFECIVEIAPSLQALFLEELLTDPAIADKLMTYYVMANKHG